MRGDVDWSHILDIPVLEQTEQKVVIGHRPCHIRELPYNQLTDSLRIYYSILRHRLQNQDPHDILGTWTYEVKGDTYEENPERREKREGIFSL